jgi:hypothetical protein
MRLYTASFCSEVLREESNSEFSGLLGYRRIGNKVHESSFFLIRASVGGDTTELHVPSMGRSSINGEREMTAHVFGKCADEIAAPVRVIIVVFVASEKVHWLPVTS